MSTVMITSESSVIGQRVEELETPVLLVDLDVFESNLHTILSYCRQHDTLWRPHSKSHKCPEIARIELEAGAEGITCAKLSEAEVMVEHGIGPILIANEVVTPNKLQRLARLQEHQEVMMAVDDVEVVAPAGRAARSRGVSLPVLIEVDIGMDRAGVAAGDEVVQLAARIADTDGLDLRGVMGYEGHVLAIADPEEKIRACHDALDILLEARDQVSSHCLGDPIVSAGGTGCYEITAAYPGITELQAGGGVFMDAMYRYAFHVTSLEFALTCLSTVTSRRATHVIVDAGFKTLSAHHQAPVPLDHDELELRYLSAEHGVFDLREGATGPHLAEKIRFLVGYSDSTTVLHDRFLGVRDGRVECVWEIVGRGKLE